MTKPKPGAHYHHWTAEEDALVLAQAEPAGVLARRFSVAIFCVYSRLSKLRRQAGIVVPPLEKHVKHCVVCGAEFRAEPSGNVTCGPACASARRGEIMAARNKQGVSEKARQTRRAMGWTPNLQRAQFLLPHNPLLGSFETNVRAKQWCVIHMPTQRTWALRNLRMWCRENAYLFEPDPWEHAYGGLRMVQMWLVGRTKKRQSRWKDWSLYSEAEKP